MKKSLFILASLALGTAAIAQDMPQTPPSATNTPTDSAAPAAPAAPMPADTAAPATNTMTPAPDASAAPAAAAAPDAAAMAPAATDTSSYPTCSRKVTDKCVQRGAVRRHK